MADDDRRDERRPDPDALLALADKDRRGKLTVFLGAAPGVGKTYAMLGEAQRRAAKIPTTRRRKAASSAALRHRATARLFTAAR